MSRMGNRIGMGQLHCSQLQLNYNYITFHQLQLQLQNDQLQLHVQYISNFNYLFKTFLISNVECLANGSEGGHFMTSARRYCDPSCLLVR